MPELPEVENVMRGMRRALEGQVIARIILRRPDLRWPIPPELPEIARGARVVSLRRRGKYILIRLERADMPRAQSILLHMGMSGRILIEDNGDRAPALHEHVVIETESGMRLGFVDPRRFGAFGLVFTDEEDGHPLLRSLGVEPVGASFDAGVLRRSFEGRKTSIKVSLLDQGLIAGLGNIYVCEALFRARIHPERLAASLSEDEVARLAEAIPAILEEAIEAGGSTLRDYVGTDGRKGAFQELHRVYGREGEPCPDCPGRPVCPGVRRMTQNARSTFYCPRLQLPVWTDEK